ncbi:hypothetical protein BRADI_5g23542v3 [Brachypodium distachyon]|uniref:Uncharacterized protein n=1 Tax=Brachypodium distachyon TaxID=15368 RepID=A0A0Q3KXN1_BRADI|nr:hypothetical protein BRADI_5g23542v3 [Brachypodium distachyon]
MVPNPHVIFSCLTLAPASEALHARSIGFRSWLASDFPAASREEKNDREMREISGRRSPGRHLPDRRRCRAPVLAIRERARSPPRSPPSGARVSPLLQEALLLCDIDFCSSMIRSPVGFCCCVEIECWVL